jgi:hypothetical protein
MSDTVNEFDAAKAVFEQLKGLDKEQQARVLRWVAESLEIAVHVKSVHHETYSAPVAAVGGDAGSGARSEAAPRTAAASIRTFVEEKAPKSDVQFAAVVAYYYRFEASAPDRKDAVDAAALQEAARHTGRKRLAQPAMTLNNAKNMGYLDSSSRGQFRINTVGENLVAMALPGGATKATKGKAARKRGG